MPVERVGSPAAYLLQSYSVGISILILFGPSRVAPTYSFSAWRIHRRSRKVRLYRSPVRLFAAERKSRDEDRRGTGAPCGSPKALGATETATGEERAYSGRRQTGGGPGRA